MASSRLLCTLALVAVGLLFIATTPLQAQDIDRNPYSLGAFHRSITTASEDAQLWFDRGLALCYAFNHCAYANARACSVRKVGQNPAASRASSGAVCNPGRLALCASDGVCFNRKG